MLPIAKFEQESTSLEIDNSEVVAEKVESVPLKLDHSWYARNLESIQQVREDREPDMVKDAAANQFVPMLGQGQIVTLKLECKDPYISQLLFKALHENEFIAGCIIHTIFFSDLNSRIDSMKRRIEDAIKLDEH